MECLAVKIIQSESHCFFHDQICRRQRVLVFLGFCSAPESELKIFRGLEKREEAGSKKKAIVTMFIEFASSLI